MIEDGCEENPCAHAMHSSVGRWKAARLTVSLLFFVGEGEAMAIYTPGPEVQTCRGGRGLERK